MMKPISDADLATLRWLQRGSKEDELVSGNDTLGTLHWNSLWSSLATAESADGKWTFKRQGFLHPKITIRELGAETDLHMVSVSWTGEATLQLPDQGTFRWVPNLWHTNWSLQDQNGKEIARVELNGFIRVSGSLTIDKASLTPRLTLLILLGWYLIMLVLSDDASATAAIVPVI